MKSDQEDRLNMYYEVNAAIEKWRSIWESNPVFSSAYTDFSTILSTIETNRDAQLAHTQGPSSEKSTVWESLVQKTLFLSNRIQSYANTTKNIELHAEVTFTVSDLKKSRDSHLIGICNIIIARANANLAALAPYSVTTQLIQELQQLLTSYSTIKTKPRAVRSEVKNATDNLRNNFKDVDAILSKRLDLDIEVFKSSNHDFYSQYLSARTINSTGSKTSLLVIRVVDAATKLPLPNVLCTITLQSDTSVTFVKKTAKHGILYVPNVGEGKYTVKSEKIGLTTHEVSIVMEKGKSQTVIVAM